MNFQYSKEPNIELLEEQVRALAFAAIRGFAGCSWLHAALEPEPAKRLVVHFRDSLTAAEESQLGTLVAAHNRTGLTAGQLARNTAIATDTADLTEIRRLANLATPTGAEVADLAKRMARRLFA